jgi:hypothetical protein
VQLAGGVTAPQFSVTPLLVMALEARAVGALGAEAQLAAGVVTLTAGVLATEVPKLSVASTLKL